MGAVRGLLDRRMKVLGCVTVLALASACGGAPDTNGAPEVPETPVAGGTAPLPPPLPPEVVEPAAPTTVGTFVAVSNTAMSFTGDLTITTGAIVAALDQRYSVGSASRVPASETYAAGAGTWAQLLALPEGSTVQLHRVVSQAAGANAPNGSFCGGEKTTYLGIALASDSLGEPALKIAAFKGKKAPGPKASEGELCGTFSYSATAPKPAA